MNCRSFSKFLVIRSMSRLHFSDFRSQKFTTGIFLAYFNKLCFTFTIFSHLQGESAAPRQSLTTQTRHPESTSLTGTIFTGVLRSLPLNRKGFVFPASFTAKRPLFRPAVTHESIEWPYPCQNKVSRPVKQALIKWSNEFVKAFHSYQWEDENSFILDTYSACVAHTADHSTD